MKVIVFAALGGLIMTSAAVASQGHRQALAPALTCDNNGRCMTADAPAPASHGKRTRTAMAPAVDANGNAAGMVVSHKTGAHARVGSAYAGRFQAYIDDL